MGGSGYTYPVIENKVTTLEQYAMLCVRGIGYLAYMRDDSLSKPIPQEIPGPSSDYHQDALKRAVEESKVLSTITREQIEARIEEEHLKYLHSTLKDRRTRRVEDGRLDRMLLKVLAWKVPTPEHEELKKMMIDQLVQTINFNSCKRELPKKSTPEEWLKTRKEMNERDLKYHDDHLKEERENHKKAQAYVDALRDCFKKKRRKK